MVGAIPTLPGELVPQPYVDDLRRRVARLCHIEGLRYALKTAENRIDASVLITMNVDFRAVSL